MNTSASIPGFRRPRSIVAVLTATLATAACATLPTPPPAPAVSYEQKIAWMLRLEDQRVLRDPSQPQAIAPVARHRTSPAPPQPAAPDLAVLLADQDGRVRRRAALAIGRVGLADGVPPLLQALAVDPEPEVRQMAAFALGLLRASGAVETLRTALGDRAAVVQGRAAEALGAIGDAASAPAIGAMVTAHIRAGALSTIDPDDMADVRAPAADAVRLGVFALGRLKAYDPLAAAVLDSAGRPAVFWWPVAYALQRTGDSRALTPLLALVAGPSRVGRAFAARGLGALKAASALDRLVALAEGWAGDTRSAVSAVRAMGQLGDSRAVPPLLRLLQVRAIDPLLHLTIIEALGTLRAASATERLLDLVASPSPAVRAAALGSLRAIDQETFLLVLSGLDPDRHWSVRAMVARLAGSLPAAAAMPQLTRMLRDEDVRVIPSVIAALGRVRPPEIESVLLSHLRHDDPVVRAAAARALGDLAPASGPVALAAAFRAAARDEWPAARLAILSAVAAYGGDTSRTVLREALGDRDWAVRARAASLLATRDPLADPATAIRPAPTGRIWSFYEAAELVTPSVSPHVFVETDRGTIEIELAVLDAPLTAASFMDLARRGVFDGSPWHRVVPDFVVQGGDPRGDGEGGPGSTIRDEINEQAFTRGTLGLALDGADTGGSQFFITHSPQPHLDGRYTVFGRVVEGLDVVDRLQPWDTIVRARVWDGTTMSGRRVQ